MLHKNSQSQGRYVKIIRADAEQTRSTDQFQRGEHRQEIKGLLKINETAKQAVELFNKCECVNTCVSDQVLSEYNLQLSFTSNFSMAHFGKCKHSCGSACSSAVCSLICRLILWKAHRGRGRVAQGRAGVKGNGFMEKNPTTILMNADQCQTNFKHVNCLMHFS